MLGRELEITIKNNTDLGHVMMVLSEELIEALVRLDLQDGQNLRNLKRYGGSSGRIRANLRYKYIDSKKSQKDLNFNAYY
jgi:hypothetical protein